MDKPKPHTVVTLNLFNTLDYLEKYRKGIKDRIWQYLCNGDRIRGNDTHCYAIYFEDDSCEGELGKDFALLFEEYPEAGNFLWDISW